MSGPKNKIYLAGSFLGWRDKVIEMLPGFNFADPRHNRQDAIAKLVEDDMSAAKKCPILLAHYIGTMSYAELGASRANGNCVIVVDENNQYPLVDKAASARFSRLEEAVDFIKSGEWKNSKKPGKIRKLRDYRVKPEDCLNVFLTGRAGNSGKSDLADGLADAEVKKKILTEADLQGLPDFGSVDLTVVNFERGARDKKAVFFMGLSYALETPIIMIEKNPIIYPPLAGLARRIFVGDEGEKAARDYLSQLSSQDIGTEAKTMYGLLKKYRS